MNRRILHVVTNVAHYDDPSHRTGLWLSELTHAYDLFAGQGHEQHLVSPRGGHSPLEPRSLKWPALDHSAKAWLQDPARMALLDNTLAPDNVDAAARFVADVQQRTSRRAAGVTERAGWLTARRQQYRGAGGPY